MSGQPALRSARFAEDSKDILDAGLSTALNSRSITDLQQIRKTLGEQDISVEDLQFLVSKDGRVVIADPLAVQRPLVVSQRQRNIATIDRLIEIAKGGD